jgi:hypothetical protein
MARERLPPIVVGKLLLPLGLVLSFEEAEVWAERERKGRWVVKKGRRQGALAQTMQAANSISLLLLVVGVRAGGKRGWGNVRPGYDGLKGVGDVAVAYADPGYNAEETHETDDTRAVGRTCQFA